MQKVVHCRSCIKLYKKRSATVDPPNHGGTLLTLHSSSGIQRVFVSIGRYRLVVLVDLCTLQAEYGTPPDCSPDRIQSTR